MFDEVNLVEEPLWQIYMYGPPFIPESDSRSKKSCMSFLEVVVNDIMTYTLRTNCKMNAIGWCSHDKYQNAVDRAVR